MWILVLTTVTADMEDEDEKWEEEEALQEPDSVALRTRGRCASRCGASGDEDAATYCETDAPEHETDEDETMSSSSRTIDSEADSSV